MRARDYAQTGFLIVAAFLVGLIWARNWWGLAAGAFGVVLMVLVCAAKHQELKADYERLLADKTRECQQRVRDAVNEYRRRGSILTTLSEDATGRGKATHSDAQARL